MSTHSHNSRLAISNTPHKYRVTSTTEDLRELASLAKTQQWHKMSLDNQRLKTAASCIEQNFYHDNLAV